MPLTFSGAAPPFTTASSTRFPAAARSTAATPSPSPDSVPCGSSASGVRSVRIRLAKAAVSSPAPRR
ncbi:hypothetical protein AB0895_04495 [Streptomyces globisporus]|uniref:hypothetical protein n=1 Tax=Streptomyces globisporus TaxID=1908 RepID=UPI0034605EFB